MTQDLHSRHAFEKHARPLQIVLAGGSGHVGTVLLRHFFSQGHTVTLLSRRPVVSSGKVVLWDGVSLGDWRSELRAGAWCLGVCWKTAFDFNLLIGTKLQGNWWVAGEAVEKRKAI